MNATATRTVRTARPTLLAVVAVSALAACSGEASLSETPTTVAVAATVAPPSTAAPAPPSTAPPAPPPLLESPGRCPAERVVVEVHPRGAAMDGIGFALVFTNTGPRACTLTGFPGVSLRGRQGEPLGEADRFPFAPTTPVSLEPGGRASALLVLRNEGKVEGCTEFTPVASVAVIPPDDTATLFVPFEHDRCVASPAPFRIGPVQPGETPTPT